MKTICSNGIDFSVGYEFRRAHGFEDDFGLSLNTDVDDQWVLGIGFRHGTAALPYTHGRHP